MLGSIHHGSAGRSASPFGILYAEDFDHPAELDRHGADARAPEPPPITQADVDAACAAAVRAAQIDWQRTDERARLDAIASLGPVLAGIRDATERSALAVAETTVTTILSIITGLLPHLSREHGMAEVRALLGRLLPTIRSETRIIARVHPDLVASIQRDIAELEPDLAAMIDVAAAPVERGDVKVSWENGSMVRDSRKIIQAVEDVLGLLGLQQPVEAPSKKVMAYAD